MATSLIRAVRCPTHLSRRGLCSAAGRESVDVLVVGGGLVGGAFAAALASSPLSRALSVAVVDPQPPPAGARAAAPSLRTSTVSPSSASFLADAGVWQRVPPARRAPFADMLVWESPAGAPGALGAIRFDARDLPAARELGFVVDNDTLRTAVFDQLRALAHTADVRLLETRVQSIAYRADDSDAHERDPNEDVPWPVVTLENGDQVAARLIVAADGARSRIRNLARFDWFSYPYDQTAVVANVALDRPLTTAYQRFLSTGPIALLPVASDIVSEPMANIIWSTTPVEAEALSAADDVVFIDEVNMALRGVDTQSAPPPPPGSAEEVVVSATEAAASAGPTNGESLHVGVPKCQKVMGVRGRFPLSMGHAPQYVDASRRTVLLGDAAHNVHPLAGQGANLGFADARSLADALGRAAATGRDVGGENGAPLLTYERERMAANVAMMGTLHSLQIIFGQTSWSPFNLARRFGVSTLDKLSPVKRLILKAMS